MSVIQSMSLPTLIGGSVGLATSLITGNPSDAIKAGLSMGYQISRIGNKIKEEDNPKDNLKREDIKAKSQFYKTLESTTKQFADDWSKLILAGYCIQIGMSGSETSMEVYQKFCKSFFDSLGCASISLTTLAFTGASALMMKRVVDKISKNIDGKDK